MLKLSWKRGASVVGAVALFALGGVAVTTSSASGPKTYTVSWASVSNSNQADSSRVPLYAGRRSSSAAITITNTSNNKISFAAVNIGLPAGLPVSGTPDLRLVYDFSPTNPAATIALNAGRLELRNVDVPRGKSVTASVDIDVPCAGGSYVLTTDVRQSNDFNGTLNTFAAENGTPLGGITMTTTGSCSLAFNPGPASSSMNTTITSVADDPAGAAIKVEARDGSGTVMPWWSSAIILTTPATKTGGTGVVTGTTATAQSNGVATFAPSIDTEGTGYRLVASSSGITSATSSTFDIRRTSANITCTAGDDKDCETGTITAPTGATANVKLNDSDGVTANLVASFVTANFNCGLRGYTATSEQLNFDVITQNDLTGLTKTVTVNRPLAAAASTDPLDYQVCFAAPYDFPALDLDAGQLQDDFTSYDFSANTDLLPNIFGTDSAYVGILLPCDYEMAPVAPGGYSPCVESRAITNGVLTLVLTVPAADPGTRF